MKRLIIFLLMLSCFAMGAQNNAISKENFINAIAASIVDSSFTHYYLSANAPACSFKKYDYEEWYKYGLKEDIPIYILEELAKKSYEDSSPYSWHQERLSNAFIIDDPNAKTILSAVMNHPAKNRHAAKDLANVVYYFSRPEFTDDYQYAVIDMGFRCDDKQCGMGATFIFHQVNAKWVVAGKKIVWGN